MRTHKQTVAMATLVVVWAVAVGIGIHVLWRYSTTPGILAHPPDTWPGGVSVRLSANRNSLLLFAHPECPCSQATLGELERILACCRDRAETTVFFYIPKGDPMGWSGSDLVKYAGRIPEVRLVHDIDGITARSFGVHTSGQILVYDSRGRLAFNGGITASRGHSGDNDGRAAVVSLLRGLPPARNGWRVFGCSLFSEN